MAFKTVFARTAARDIFQTFDFMATRSLKSARQWLEGIQRSVKSLEEMPLRAPTIPEANLFNRDYRQLNFQSHRIIFDVDEEKAIVYIVRVYHSTRVPLTPEGADSAGL